MSEPPSPTPRPPIEPPRLAVGTPSALGGGCVGCLGGGFVGLLAVIAGVLLWQGTGMKPPLAALIVVLPLVVAAAAAFPRLQRQDPSFAIGALIGLAIMGLVAGFCASL